MSVWYVFALLPTWDLHLLTLLTASASVCSKYSNYIFTEYDKAYQRCIETTMAYYYHDIRRPDLRLYLLHQQSSTSLRPLNAYKTYRAAAILSTKWNFFFRQFLRPVCVCLQIFRLLRISLCVPTSIHQETNTWYHLFFGISLFSGGTNEQSLRSERYEFIIDLLPFTFLVCTSMFVPIRLFSTLRANKQTTPTERGWYESIPSIFFIFLSACLCLFSYYLAFSIFPRDKGTDAKIGIIRVHLLPPSSLCMFFSFPTSYHVHSEEYRVNFLFQHVLFSSGF